MKPFFAFLCAAVFCAHSAFGQPAAAPASAPVNTVIESEKADIWSNEAGTETYAIFTTNVVVTGTNLRITCDRLDATAEGQNSPAASPEKKTGTADNVEKFKYILATGKVHIIQGDREANCERAEVFPREGKIILTGKPVVIDRGNGSVATGEPLILFKNERRVYGENVKATFPEIKDLGFDKNTPAPKHDDAKPSKP